MPDTAPSRVRPAFALLLLLAMAMPMLVLYALGVLAPHMLAGHGWNRQQYGWLGAGSFALAALLSPFAGALVQSLGAARLLGWLFALVALGFALLASTAGGLALACALACCGMAQALCNPVTNQLIAAHAAPSQRAALIGFKQSGVQLAALLAGLLLWPLAQHIGWQAVFGWLLPPLALLWLASLRLQRHLPASPTPAPARQPALQAPTVALRWLMLAQLCNGIALAVFVAFMPLQMAQLLPGAAAAQAMAAFGAAGLLARWALPRLAQDAQQTRRTLLWLVGPTIAALLLLAQLDSASTSARPALLLLAALTLGGSAVASNALAMSLLLQSRACGSPASSAGWLSCGFFSGFAFGPPLAGLLLQHGLHFSTLWQGLAVLALPLWLALWRLGAHLRPAVAAPVAASNTVFSSLSPSQQDHA